jgi:hypothetical protein
MKIIFNINRNYEILIEPNYNKINIFYVEIHNNHISYGYYDKIICFYQLIYKDKNEYKKYFYIYTFSFCDRVKNNISKKQYLNIQTRIYNTFYSYFIYNKYYTSANMKEYNHSIKSITSKKLFSCRDYYKIYSYI